MSGGPGGRAAVGSLAIVLLLIVMSAVRNRDWQDEITLWEVAIGRAPGKGRVVYRLGRAYGDKGRWDEAFTYLTRAKELDPDLFGQYLAKPGEVYRVQGRFAEAEQEYRRQIQAEPDRPLLRNELGIALIGQRRFKEALQEFSEAIRIDPAYAMAYANRGVVNVELHQLDDAVRDFRTALELEPKNSGFHAKLGFAWFQLGRIDDAIAEYDEALRLDPGNEQARRNRSYIMVGRPSPGPRGAP
jgi:tetratricopeptide (TPR) repeat protein